MLLSNKKAFTIVELLVAIAIVSMIIGVAIVFMTRGASNVQKGSFKALAANQAAWICTVIRNDIARSDSEGIVLDCGESEPWDGSTPFEVSMEGGKASYSIEKRGNTKIFVRKFTSVGGVAGLKSKKQTFGDELLSDMTVTRKGNSYSIKIYMDEVKENKDKSEGEHDFTWSATIFASSPSGMGKYWVSSDEIESLSTED